MIARLLHREYKKAVQERLSGTSAVRTVPSGGRTQRKFTRALFVVMGRVAKLDGLVTEAEIRFASDIMHTLGLNASQRQQAVDSFYLGKQPDTNITEVLRDVVRYIGVGSPLARLFLKTQCRLAFSKGMIRLREKRLLRSIAEALGFDKAELLRVYTEIQVIDVPQSQHRDNTLSQAYRLLELPWTADDRQIRQAYRRLMARYHPDKLRGDQLTAEAQRRAQDKFMAIRSAYETISGFRRIVGP